MKTTITINKETKVTARGTHARGNHKAVFCITTGEIYASLLDAAERNNLSYTALSHNVCGRQKTVNGMKFCLVSKVTEHIEEIADRTKIAYAEEAKRQAKEKYERLQAKRDKLLKELEVTDCHMRLAESEVKKYGNTYMN